MQIKYVNSVLPVGSQVGALGGSLLISLKVQDISSSYSPIFSFVNEDNKGSVMIVIKSIY